MNVNQKTKKTKRRLWINYEVSYNDLLERDNSRLLYNQSPLALILLLIICKLVLLY